MSSTVNLSWFLLWELLRKHDMFLIQCEIHCKGPSELVNMYFRAFEGVTPDGLDMWTSFGGRSWWSSIGIPESFLKVDKYSIQYTVHSLDCSSICLNTSTKLWSLQDFPSWIRAVSFGNSYTRRRLTSDCGPQTRLLSLNLTKHLFKRTKKSADFIYYLWHSFLKYFFKIKEECVHHRIKKIFIGYRVWKS